MPEDLMFKFVAREAAGTEYTICSYQEYTINTNMHGRTKDLGRLNLKTDTGITVSPEDPARKGHYLVFSGRVPISVVSTDPNAP